MKKIKVDDLKNILIEQKEINDIKKIIEEHSDDERTGIKKLLKLYKSKVDKMENENRRMKLIQKYEKNLYSEGYKLIGGIDEVGRGPFAGPVVTAMVILPVGCVINGINDSKKLSEEKRIELYDEIMSVALSVSIGSRTAEIIDNINILNATKEAMEDAVNNSNITPDYLLIDALTLPNINIKQEGIVKGDEKSISIGAASIIAKVTRDRLMETYDELFPQYGFKKNKGYGTAFHIDAIKKHGTCPIHRLSFLRKIREN